MARRSGKETCANKRRKTPLSVRFKGIFFPGGTEKKEKWGGHSGPLDGYWPFSGNKSGRPSIGFFWEWADDKGRRQPKNLTKKAV